MIPALGISGDYLGAYQTVYYGDISSPRGLGVGLLAFGIITKINLWNLSQCNGQISFV